jgi:hypothetical protein
MRQFVQSRPTVRTLVRGLALTAVVAVAACASTPPPPPPPPPPGGSGAVLMDWRGVITAADRDRYQRRDAAWTLALQQARRQRGSGDLNSLGDLIDPKAARARRGPAARRLPLPHRQTGLPGRRGRSGLCDLRLVRLPHRTDPRGLKFTKLTGSQRPSGLLFPENDRHMLMLGSMALAQEPAANSYGRNPTAIWSPCWNASARRAGGWSCRGRSTESNLDLIELVPASGLRLD